jgi:hypothetical protein
MGYWAVVVVLVMAVAASPSARADSTYTYTFQGAGILVGDNFSVSSDGPAVVGPDYLLPSPIPLYYGEQSFTSAVSVYFVLDSFYPSDALAFNCSSEFGCVSSPTPFLGLTDLSVPGTYVLTSGNATGSSLSITALEPGTLLLTLLGLGLCALVPFIRRRWRRDGR